MEINMQAQYHQQQHIEKEGFEEWQIEGMAEMKFRADPSL